MTPDWMNAVWRKSSHSGGSGGQCVELATTCGLTAVRDSKNPDGPQLVFAGDAFSSFLRNVKAARQ
jgi:hypothetical protein